MPLPLPKLNDDSPLHLGAKLEPLSISFSPAVKIWESGKYHFVERNGKLTVSLLPEFQGPRYGTSVAKPEAIAEDPQNLGPRKYWWTPAAEKPANPATIKVGDWVRYSPSAKGYSQEHNKDWRNNIVRVTKVGEKAYISDAGNDIIGLVVWAAWDPRDGIQTFIPLDRVVKCDAEGWIPHTPGDPMPADEQTHVWVKLRSGEIVTGGYWAGEYWWTRATGSRSSKSEIIAWKPAP